MGLERKKDIEDAIPATWLLPSSQRALHSSDEHRLGRFSLVGVYFLIATSLANSSLSTLVGVPLVIAIRLANSSIIFFTIKENGRLLWDITNLEAPSLPY